MLPRPGGRNAFNKECAMRKVLLALADVAHVGSSLGPRGLPLNATSGFTV
jgi:hypothetical protein